MKNLLIIIFFSFPVWVLAQTSPASQPAPATVPQSAAAAPQPPPDSTLTQALHFADSVFSRPSFTYDLSEPDFPPDLQSILIRFNNAISANKEWFLDYRKKNAPSGGTLPYNERFGITYAEYQRIQNLEKLPPHYITISQQLITVTHDNGHIRFKGADETRILDYLEINLSERQLLFAGDTLVFVGAMNTSQLSPLGLSKGYIWRLEKADIKNTFEAGKVTARVVEINLGEPLPSTTSANAAPGTPSTPSTSLSTSTPPNTGANSSPSTPNTVRSTNPPPKTLLRIKYQDLLQGVTRADFDFIGFIH
ncbi:MAG: hypothetical protein JST68_23180 [Bacteroidetes bacterium]|nr:hypothetical protein [Bacteroidota bacterium]